MSIFTANHAKPAVPFGFPARIVQTFTEGDCWKLAQDINAYAGFTLVTASVEAGYWLHVGTMLPDGRILDIMGIWESSEWITLWQETSDYVCAGSPVFVKDWITTDLEDEVRFFDTIFSDEENKAYALQVIECSGIPVLV